MNMESASTVMEFGWIVIVPAILALTILCLGSIYLIFTTGASNRKGYKRKSSTKYSESIVKRFKTMHDQGIVPSGRSESIKEDHS